MKAAPEISRAVEGKGKGIEKVGMPIGGPPSNVEQSVALNNGENMEAVWNEYGDRHMCDA
jgi:hypothetical protein